MRILVDADACPVPIREILVRAANRVCIRTVFVANQHLRIPTSKWIEFVQVRAGSNQADHKIVEMTLPGDLIITSDIPLASRIVAKKATALGPRGEIYDDSNLGDRKSMRKLTEGIRIVSEEPFGPKPMHVRDRKQFANQLDRILTKMQNRRPVNVVTPPATPDQKPATNPGDQSLT